MEQTRQKNTNIYQWGNMTGGVGVLGLVTKNLNLLQEFRLLVSQEVFQGKQWMTFPKNAVLKKFSLTTMLQGDLTSFPLERLSFAILLMKHWSEKHEAL